MIEINLLPEELKVKAKKTVSPGNFASGFDPTYLIYIVPVAIGLLLSAHLVLGIVSLAKQAGLRSLNKEWSGLESQRKKLSSYKSEFEVNSQDAAMINELTVKSIRWSEKLNLLSKNLPPGVWFNRLLVSPKGLEIKACVFSVESNGVDLINKFLYNLKSDSVFFKDFSGLEIGNMQSKKLGSYEVMDFTINGGLKTASSSKPGSPKKGN